MTRPIAASAATLVLLAAPAVAVVAEIDLDGDGAYSLSEVQTAMPDVTADEFMIMDANGDGLLDENEVAAAIEAGLMPDPAS